MTRQPFAGFDAAIFIFANNPSWVLTRNLFGEGSPLGNPEIERHYQRAQLEPDPDVRYQIYREAMEILRVDLPITFLFPNTRVTAAHRRVRGLRPGDPTVHLWEAWLEDGN